MRVSITTEPHARTLTITVTDVDWEQTQQRSFYQGEQAVQGIVTAVGRELVQELLQSKEVAELTWSVRGSGGIAKRHRLAIITRSMGKSQWSAMCTKRAREEKPAVPWKKRVNWVSPRPRRC